MSGEFGVTAFGKHPGWADHIDDIPIPTPVLKRAREMLYARGIRRVIDRGGWAEIPDEKRLGGLDHSFLWLFEGAAVAGRLRRSTDASGRSAYPFVICAQAPEELAGWLVGRAPELFDRLDARCRETTDAGEVAGAVSEAHEELLARSASAEASVRTVTRTGEIASGETPGRTGLHRILYQIEREMRAFGTAGKGTASERIDTSARHIRLPGLGGEAFSALVRWAGFVREHVAPTAPVLAVGPAGGAWCDVIVGEPDEASLVPLMMNASGMRLASEEAYELDDAFCARADRWIDRGVEEIAERSRRPAGKGGEAARGKGLGLGRWFRGRAD